MTLLQILIENGSAKTLIEEPYRRRIAWMAQNMNPYVVFAVVDMLHPPAPNSTYAKTIVSGGWEESTSVLNQSLTKLVAKEAGGVAGDMPVLTPKGLEQRMRDFVVDKATTGKWFRGRHNGTDALPDTSPYEKMLVWIYRQIKQSPQDYLKLSREIGGIADWHRATRTNLDNYTANQALYACRRWHAALRRQKEEDAAPLLPDTVVGKVGDITVYKLGAEHVSSEGKAMKNCVGSYAKDVAGGHRVVYSARRAGKRLYTLELDADARHLLQLKAKANRKPAAGDADAQAILSFLEDEGVSVRCYDTTEVLGPDTEEPESGVA